jgi:hypothetical protein
VPQQLAFAFDDNHLGTENTRRPVEHIRQRPGHRLHASRCREIAQGAADLLRLIDDLAVNREAMEKCR